MSRIIWGAVFVLAAVGCDDSDGGSTDPADAAPTDAFVFDMFPDAAPDAEVPTCNDDGECPAGQWCRPDPDGFFSYCTAGGCKAGDADDCGELMACNTETRECERTEVCDRDDQCLDGSYCDLDQNRCAEGCRVLEEDLCPFDGEIEQKCDPETHRCTPVAPCCDGENCIPELPSLCASPVAEESCFNPNPCQNRCDADADCGDDDYCAADRFCRRGCRVGACPDGAVCDEDSRTCELIPCQADGDCPDEAFCNGANLCVLGCRTAPDNCEPPSFCTNARQCSGGGGCDGDEICVQRNSPGWYCERGQCHAPCRLDSECPGGQICEDGRCAPGCRGDELEDNDLRESAAVVELDIAGLYENPNLSACQDDRDWYRFEIPAIGWDLNVAALFRHAEGDLDARLHPPEGAPIELASQDDNESWIGVADVAGVWLFEVFPRGVDQNNYTLRVEATPPLECVPDGAEAEGGDDAAEDAVLLPSEGARVEHRVRGRTICEGDDDWFQMQLGQGDGLLVRLFLGGNRVDENNDLEFQIYGPGLPEAGDEPAFVPNVVGGGGAMMRFVEFGAPVGNEQIIPGTYYLRVFGFDEAQWGNYELRVEIERGRVLCLADEAEPNSERGDAFDLMAVEGFTRDHINGGIELVPGFLRYPGLQLCGDEDWFQVELREGDDLDAAIVRTEEEIRGDTIVEIVDAEGDRVGLAGRNAQERNAAVATDVAAGTYWIRVQAVIEATESQYTLELNRRPEPVACPADRFEVGRGNDTRGNARSVMPGDLDGLVLCGEDGDEDWFVVETDSVADIEVEALFDHLQADLQVLVYREDEPVAQNQDQEQGQSDTDNEQVRLGNRLPGRYFVRVFALDAQVGQYDLRIRVTDRAFICEDDDDEPNETLEDAVDIGDGVLRREAQWICDRVPSEVDTFVLQVGGGVTRSVAATFLFGDDGDLALDVYNEDGELVVTTAIVPRNNSKQCVHIPSFAGDRTLWVQVVPLAINRINEDDERLDYSLIVENGDTCDDILPITPGVSWPEVPPPF